MDDAAASRIEPCGPGPRTAIEEAYGLALEGRADEALRLIDETLALVAGSSVPDVHTATLARSRIALAKARQEQSQEPADAFGALASLDGPCAWRVLLQAARLSLDAGDRIEAAKLLARAIEQFRLAAEPLGPFAGPLSGLLSREAERLDREETLASAPPRKPPAAAVDPIDPACLLRVVELGRSLVAATDPDEVLRLVPRHAIDLVSAERGFVVRVRGEEIEFAFAENLDRSEIDEPAFEVSRALVRTATRENRPILLSLPDLSEEHPAKASLARAGVISVACIPIVDDGRALGALYLDRRDSPHGFDARDAALLALFAAQAGTALGNAMALREKTRALEAAEETIRLHRAQSAPRASFGTLVGASEAMQEVYRRLDLFVRSQAPVLILGETGTGKELVARLIHERGPRSGHELVAVNCAGLSDTVLESELFGHERGAFTGADRSRAGLFEVAHRGTLFLDEVGDMSPRMQADLLRVLQSGEVRRVGGRETIHVDVRVVAATHRNLEAMVREGGFRQDLFYRLNVLSLRLPSLRERPDDIPLLVGALLERLREGPRSPEIAPRALRRMTAYGWPGNVRELENVLRRVVVLGVSPVEERDLPAELIVGVSNEPSSPGALRDAERESIRRALEAAGNNKAKAARMLGIDRTTLYDKLRRLGKH